jgi:hypothetical protein
VLVLSVIVLTNNEFQYFNLVLEFVFELFDIREYDVGTLAIYLVRLFIGIISYLLVMSLLEYHYMLTEGKYIQKAVAIVSVVIVVMTAVISISGEWLLSEEIVPEYLLQIFNVFSYTLRIEVIICLLLFLVYHSQGASTFLLGLATVSIAAYSYLAKGALFIDLVPNFSSLYWQNYNKFYIAEYLFLLFAVSLIDPANTPNSYESRSSTSKSTSNHQNTEQSFEYSLDNIEFEAKHYVPADYPFFDSDAASKSYS